VRRFGPAQRWRGNRVLIHYAHSLIFFILEFVNAEEQPTHVDFCLPRTAKCPMADAGHPVRGAHRGVAYAAVLVFGPAFLIAGGNSAPAAAAAVSLVSWVSWVILVSLPLGGYLAQRLETPNLLMAACFAGLALIAIALAVGMPPLLACALFGLVAGPPCGLIMAMPGEVLTARNRAAGMGVYFTCYSVGMTALIPLAGALRDVTKDPATPLWFAALMLVGAAIALGGFRLVQGRAPASAGDAATGR
jgi:hypothetical protein